MANGLFHEECGSMLEPKDVESEETDEEITLRYCGDCDEYVDAEIGDEFNITVLQDDDGEIEEIVDDDMEVAATNYDFDNCEHEMGILHQQSASRGDEDDLIMYECIECGNRERETYTRF